MLAFPTSCPECDSTHILFDRVHDEVVCGECGLILLEAIPAEKAFLETMARNSVFAGSHGPSRSPFSVEGLATTIDRRDRDAAGRMLSASEAARASRLRRLNRRTKMNNGTQRNLAYALHDIRRKGMAMGLPAAVIARTAKLYKMAVERKITVGRNAQRLMAGCVFIACREYGVPRTADEIAAGFFPEEKSTVGSRKHILKAQRLLRKEMGIETVWANPGQYVARFCSELDLGVEVQAECGKLLEEAAGKEVSGGNPVSTAAVAVYVASLLKGKKVRQVDVARVTGITDGTLRSRSRALIKALGLSVQGLSV